MTNLLVKMMGNPVGYAAVTTYVVAKNTAYVIGDRLPQFVSEVNSNTRKRVSLEMARLRVEAENRRFVANCLNTEAGAPNA